MATYHVTSPEGHTYEVNGPDGASQDEVLAQVMAQHNAPQQSAAEHYAGLVKQAAALPQDDPTQGQPWQVNAAAGFGKAGMDTVHGIEQLFGARSPQQVAEDRTVDAPLMHNTAGVLGNVAGQAAQIAVPIPAGAAIKATSWAGKLAPVVGAAARGGAYGATQEVGDGETRAGNAATNAALGAGGQGVAMGMGRVAKAAAPIIDEAKAASMATLERLGIPTHLSQVSDSGFLKLVSSVANKLPFSGVTRAGRNQDAAVSNALGNFMGMKNVTSLSDKVMAAAEQKISNAYDTVFGRNTVKMDPTTIANLRAVAQAAASDLTPDKAKIVVNQIHKFISKADANGEIPGRAYQNIRLGMKALEANPEHGHLVKEVRKVMEDAANRSFSGPDAQLFQQTQDQFRNRKIIEMALKENTGATGHVRPGALWRATSGKYGATQDMRDLAQAGQVILKDGIPDSGTSQREMVNRLLGLGGGAGAASFFGMLPLALKAAAGGAVAGQVLNSKTAARLLPGVGSKTVNGLARLSRGLPAALPATVNAKKKH